MSVSFIVDRIVFTVLNNINEKRGEIGEAVGKNHESFSLILFLFLNTWLNKMLSLHFP